jgi:hypothetical protein
LFIVGLSYNQPKFCSSASWNPNAITFADNNTVGINPYGLFVNIDNTVYVADRSLNSILVWLQGNTNPTSTLSGGLANPFGIFASITGDIYIDNSYSNGQVDKWSPNGTGNIVTMYVNGRCYGVFVDIYDNLYCALNNFHEVVKRSFNDNANTSTIVAGNGTNGSASNMLNQPRGIFVEINFNLYVADCFNHRVQLFQAGQFNGTTIAGSGATGTITLAYPTDVVLDADGYLFISDTNNNRIVGSSPDGFRCIVGCLGTSGLASNQLNTPWSISFDSYGNIFVADAYNSRIQKFLLAPNSCGKSLIVSLTN